MKASKMPVVTDIQRFCMHDGEGVRTTVFFQGCPLSCRWCHNPETQSKNPVIMFAAAKCVMCGACAAVCPKGAQKLAPKRDFDRVLCEKCGRCAEACPTDALRLSGTEMSVEDIMAAVKKDRAFYGEKGGLTVSGGEPTLRQSALVELLSAAKAENISTCVETCGVFSEALAERLCPLVDMFLFDIKDTDKIRLAENTSGNLDEILERLFYLDNAGKKTVLRCILIPGVNMNDEHIKGLAKIYKRLKNCLCVELLPYHPYGSSKSEQIGEVQRLYEKPEKSAVIAFAEKLKSLGVNVKCYGTEI